MQDFPDSLQCRRPWFDSWVRKISWRRDKVPTPVFLGFPGGSAGKISTCSAGDLGSIPGLGRFPGEGKGYPLQYSGLENSMDCIVHGVTKSRTRLSNFHFHLGQSRKGERPMRWSEHGNAFRVELTVFLWRTCRHERKWGSLG